MKVLILSCEHGGNDIPLEYQHLFEGAEKVLESHKGFDSGTLDLTYKLKPLATFTRLNSMSRLVIDFNRSENHPNLFSQYTRDLDSREKKKLIEGSYRAYHAELEDHIRSEIEKGNTVLHVSVHSFVNFFDGKVRDADIAFLYDPSRELEKNAVNFMSSYFSDLMPDMKVRMNYPYKGVSDGLTKYFRKIFESNYAGIELEVNQKLEVKKVFPETLVNSIYYSVNAFLSHSVLDQGLIL